MIISYPHVKAVHVACVTSSGALFFLRGVGVLSGSRYANHPAVAGLSYGIDTTLLVSAVTLTVILHQYPFVAAWLTVKVGLLAIYILLGIFALRRGRTQAARAAYFIAALLTYGVIVGVAVRHNPLGWFAS